MFKRILIFFLMLFPSFDALAQTEEELQLVKEIQEMVNKASAQLAEFRNLDNDQKKALAYDLLVIADVSFQLGKTDEAYGMYDAAARIFSETGCGGYEIYYSNVLKILGSKQFSDKNYDAAMNYFRESKRVLKDAGLENSVDYWGCLYNSMQCSCVLKLHSVFRADAAEFDRLSERLELASSDEYHGFLMMKLAVSNLVFDEQEYIRDIGRLTDLTIAKYGSMSLRYLLVLGIKAEHDMQIGRMEESIESIRTAYEILRNEDVPMDEHERKSNLALFHSMEAKAIKGTDPLRAEELLLMALEEDVNKMYGVNNDLGVLYYDYFRKPEAALRYWNAHKEILEARGDSYSIDYLTNQLNIGRYYLSKEDSNRSIAIFDKVASLSEQHYGKSHPTYIASIVNMANFYQSIGNYAKAEEYTEESLHLYSGLYGENSEKCGNAYYNLGLICMNQGRLREAEEYLHSSCAILEQLNSVTLLSSYSLLMLLYGKQARIDECLEMNDKCGRFVEEYKIEDNDSAVLNYYVSASEVLYDLNLPESKIISEYILTSLEHNGRTSTVQYLRAMSLYAKSSFLDNSHEEEIIPKYLESFKNQYVSKFSQYNQAEREALLGDEMIKEIRSILFTSRQTDEYDTEICDYLILSKGLLLETLNLYSQAVNRSGDEKLQESYRQLTELNRYINGETDSHPQFDSRNKAIRHASLLERDITESVSELGLLDNSLEISSADIRTSLHEDELVVEFINYQDYVEKAEFYAAMLIFNERDKPVYVRLCRADELKTAISVSQTQLYGEGETSEYVYSLIWKPLEAYLEKAETVYFSPSGYLYNMAVEHLYDGKKRLSESRNLVRLSSTRELCIDKGSAEYASAVLYGGLEYDEYEGDVIPQNRGAVNGWYYLQGTFDEVMAIYGKMSRAKVDATLYMGSNGSEESFKALSGRDIPMLHIATHGFYIPEYGSRDNDYLNVLSQRSGDGRRPSSMLRSGLVLAGGNKTWQGEVVPGGQDDGILSASEVASVDLNACDIVVLSACETGLGDVTDEGVMGLQRAFKQAGVNTIVMSLWPVDDAASAMLMENFYGNLLAGKGKRAAFNDAVKKIRKKYPDPRHWAAFVMLD